MYSIKTYNNIAQKGLDVFSEDSYTVSPDAEAPEGIVLRSYKLHDEPIADSVLAIGRAGAGVNNIPIDNMTERGIAVFNAPGANANAVKELVIASLLISTRNMCAAREFTKKIEDEGDALSKEVENAKKQFAGTEIRGKVLGVIGLGAIGVEVANAASELGMRVIGFDPHLNVHNALKLSARVERTEHEGEIYAEADYLTVHVPLIDATRNMINEAVIERMKKGVILLNFSRDGIYDDGAVMKALDDGEVARYVSDFPTRALIDHEKVVTFPHLGASTQEAEEASSVMAAQQLKEYLEEGNITNAVNLPNVSLPRAGKTRIACVHKNQPAMLANITQVLGDNEINIAHIVNECRGDVAYTLLDTDSEFNGAVTEAMEAIEGMIRVRVL